MSTLKRNLENKTKLQLNDQLIIQAANGEGDCILSEILKQDRGEKYIKPNRLQYIHESKCWLNHKGKVVLFNIAQNPTDAVKVISNYMSDTLGEPVGDDAATASGGVITLDKGTVVSLDPTADKVKKAVRVKR